jgi:hypothetical protein
MTEYQVRVKRNYDYAKKNGIFRIYGRITLKKSKKTSR